jgi:predicted metal-dependent peptidase
MIELENTILNLMSNKPFLGHIIQQMKRVLTDTVPIAAISVTTQINLYVNPRVFAALTLIERTAVLEHEIGHLLHEHIQRGQELADTGIVDDDTRHKVYNQAADFAINSNLPHLPKFMTLATGERTPLCHVENFPEWELEKGLTAEYYFKKIPRENEEKHTDHKKWAESTKDITALQEKIKSAVNRAASQAGTVPKEYVHLVDNLNHGHREWQNELQKFAARVLQSDSITTRKRINRRYGIIYPGTRTDTKLHLACVVDTSGSMSKEALEQIASELHHISKSGVMITVIEADCIVQNVGVFNKKTFKGFKGRGGTAYTPAIAYAQEHLEVDGLIYFGDFDTSDVPVKPTMPVLWVGVNTNQKPPVEWGRVIYAKIS